jgi:hypothetical protein
MPFDWWSCGHRNAAHPSNSSDVLTVLCPRSFACAGAAKVGGDPTLMCGYRCLLAHGELDYFDHQEQCCQEQVSA